ncbi:tetratricopeptide repeat protein [Sedimenticola sp.]|uniref:tetratricopeptide repeat protein n=1 Tax=Sedimenticola sp. TaxID=1940285 RepID=UPI003D134F30
MIHFTPFHLPKASLSSYLSAAILFTLFCFVSPSQSIAGQNSQALNDSELQTLSADFVAAINRQDFEALSKLFDLQALGERTARTIFNKESDIKKFNQGFLSRGRMTFIRSTFGQVLDEKGQAKYLRILHRGDKANPLIRVDIPSGGFEYVILTVQKNLLGELAIVDIFTATSGKNLSTSLGAAAQLLVAPNDSMLKKLFGIKKIDKQMSAKFRELGKLRREKRYADAYDLINKLPLEVRTKRVIIDLAIQLAQTINDEEYFRQLSLLEKYYGDDPSTAFMLIDHFYTQGNMAKVNHSIDRMIDEYGKDAALMNLKCSIAFTSKKYSEAIAYAKEATRLEPDYEDGHWSLVALYVTTRQYDNVVAALKNVETDLGYQFSKQNFVDDEFYADFVKSEAFYGWFD